MGPEFTGPEGPRRDRGQPRRRPARWVLAAGTTAGVLVLAGGGWVTLSALHSPARPTAARHHAPRPASSPAVVSTPPATPSPKPKPRPKPANAGPPGAPVRVCDNKAILGGGPAAPPPGAVAIPAGNDSNTVIAHNYTIKPHTTYWFAPGVHTLGPGQFTQIIASDGDTFIGAPGAVLDGQHQNLKAFTQGATDVTIRYLTIQNFGTPGSNGGEGVVNGDEATGWVIDHDTLQHDAGAGAMLGNGNVLSWSCLRDNGEYGFQGGGSGILVAHNEVSGNNTDNWEARSSGCGCSGGSKFWESSNVTIADNYVHDNLGPGLWADTNNRGFNIEGNYVSGNQGEGLIYEISYNLRLADNTFVRNSLVDGPLTGGFPDGAVYISESGSDPRVAGPYGQTMAITGNKFINNWAGVVLWENADRFCNSPDNSSTGTCTLVDPSAVTTKTCAAGIIAKQPYFGDCRWKTQNVLVSGNTFMFRPSAIGPKCTVANMCGFNGIFSQYGTQPSWSPYHGFVVENHITFGQNNHFRSNTYIGPWHFLVHDQSGTVSFSAWQSSPYDQDAGSTMASG